MIQPKQIENKIIDNLNINMAICSRARIIEAISIAVAEVINEELSKDKHDVHVKINPKTKRKPEISDIDRLQNDCKHSSVKYLQKMCAHIQKTLQRSILCRLKI